MQKQLRRLQEDVMMRWKDEKSVVEEPQPLPPQDVKKPSSSSPPLPENGNAIPSQANLRIKKTLEAELERTKESEHKMLEFLTSQTKQLEQTKMQLEEANLEIRTLEATINGYGDMRCTKDDEIACLRNEVKMATDAEEKSNKAMDDLAIALKEVATGAEEKLKAMETQYLSARAEADHTMSMLKSADERIQSAFEETQRTKSEAEEAASSWRTKEERFVECIKSLETEITLLKSSNDGLRNSQRSSREDVSKLRDIMKQAVNEATVMKEALEIARNENSRLQDSVAEKEQALQKMKQELECLKVSEAAAVGSVEELKKLLAATSNIEANGCCSNSNVDFLTAAAGATEHQEVEKNPTRNNEMTRVTYGSFRISSPVTEPTTSNALAKHRKFASMGSVSVRKASSGSIEGFSCELDGLEAQSAWGSPAWQKKKKKKKKKPVFRRFGDLLRGSFRK